MYRTQLYLVVWPKTQVNAANFRAWETRGVRARQGRAGYGPIATNLSWKNRQTFIKLTSKDKEQTYLA